MQGTAESKERKKKKKKQKTRGVECMKAAVFDLLGRLPGCIHTLEGCHQQAHFSLFTVNSVLATPRVC